MRIIHNAGRRANGSRLVRCDRGALGLLLAPDLFACYNPAIYIRLDRREEYLCRLARATPSITGW